MIYLHAQNNMENKLHFSQSTNLFICSSVQCAIIGVLTKIQKTLILSSEGACDILKMNTNNEVTCILMQKSHYTVLQLIGNNALQVFLLLEHEIYFK